VRPSSKSASKRPQQRRYRVGVRGNGNGRTRDAYADVGRAMRRSWDTAIEAGATAHELAALGAVIYHLASYSRMSDRILLGHIATKAGIWTGPEDECPAWASQKAGARLRKLREFGAIDYRPSKGRGLASFVSMKPAENQPAAGLITDEENQPADGRKTNPLPTENQPAAATKTNPLKGDLPRRSPRMESEEDAPRTGAQEFGPAARLTPTAPPTPPDDDMHNVWPDDDQDDDHLGPAGRLHLAFVSGYPDDEDVPSAITAEAIWLADETIRLVRNLDVIDVIAAAVEQNRPRPPRNGMRIVRSICDRHAIELPRLSIPNFASA
jgi:hypothetical protein